MEIPMEINLCHLSVGHRSLEDDTTDSIDS